MAHDTRRPSGGASSAVLATRGRNVEVWRSATLPQSALGESAAAAPRTRCCAWAMIVAAGRRGGGAAGQNGANGAERDVLRETKTVLRERVVAGRGEWRRRRRPVAGKAVTATEQQRWDCGVKAARRCGGKGEVEGGG